MGVPAGPYFSFHLPPALLLCPWTFEATWVAWFWQAAWQREVTLLA